MIRKALAVLSLVAVFSSASLPLAVLQIGVWANMFGEFYGETGSIVESMEWTFDGENRCDGCELVSSLNGKRSEVMACTLSLVEETKAIPCNVKRSNIYGLPENVFVVSGQFPVESWVQEVASPPPKNLV